MSKAFDSIKQGLQEAIAHAQINCPEFQYPAKFDPAPIPTNAPLPWKR